MFTVVSFINVSVLKIFNRGFSLSKAYAAIATKHGVKLPRHFYADTKDQVRKIRKAAKIMGLKVKTRRMKRIPKHWRSHPKWSKLPPPIKITVSRR